MFINVHMLVHTTKPDKPPKVEETIQVNSERKEQKKQKKKNLLRGYSLSHVCNDFFFFCKENFKCF